MENRPNRVFNEGEKVYELPELSEQDLENLKDQKELEDEVKESIFMGGYAPSDSQDVEPLLERDGVLCSFCKKEFAKHLINREAEGYLSVFPVGKRCFQYHQNISFWHGQKYKTTSRN